MPVITKSLFDSCVGYLVASGHPDTESLLAAAAIYPTSPIHYYKLAEACRRHGQHDLWRQCIAAAMSLTHETHAQMVARGNAKLLLGDWSGWKDREARIFDPAEGYLDTQLIRHMRYETIQWDGCEDISDKTLLVIADGSLGDCLQMLRYIPPVAQLARKVVFRVRPQAASFVRRVLGNSVDLALRGAAPSQPFDSYVWMMSLPSLFDELPPPLSDFMRRGDRKPETQIKGGICYVPDLTDRKEKDRPVTSHDLAPLLENNLIQWFDLRIDGSSALPESAHVARPATALTAMEMATILESLDVVVTVDTATAHLAGLLHIPTALLLSTDADPRWGVKKSTQWYPSIRLCRQRQFGSWTDAVAAASVMIADTVSYQIDA
jgi:hypothetical protein